MFILVTCEHGGANIPSPYRKLFAAHKKRLTTHEAYDIGALTMAKKIAPLADAFFYSTTSRLLVDLNRPFTHGALFSNITKDLSDDEKHKILKEHFFPYQKKITAALTKGIHQHGQALHVAMHSFTPSLHGKKRNADIGILYDPQRASEKRLCTSWRKQLAKHYRTRANYPYQGSSHGLTRFFRQFWSDEQYIGIEIEVNQLFFLKNRTNELAAFYAQLREFFDRIS